MNTRINVGRAALRREQFVRALMCVLAAAVHYCASGCQLAYFLNSGKMEQHAAECNAISNQKVGVVVWAEQATLDFDALARVRVGKTVTYYLRTNLPQATFVDPVTIARMQDRGQVDWEGMSNAELCKELKCDMVLRIDLLEYTTRALSARELRKGRVRGSVNLYSADASTGGDAIYRSEVVATYPPSSTQGVLDQTDETILRQTVDEFGLAVARKFHAYETDYTETGRRKERRNDQ